MYFVGYTARAGTAARFLFEFGFCYEVGLNKMADAGHGCAVARDKGACVCVSEQD